MITILFTIFALINAIMLIALLGVIYVKNTTDKDDLAQQLEKYQDMLMLGLLIGVVIALGLSALMMV